MRFSHISPLFCRFSQFLCFVKIVFTWLIPASTMCEVWNAGMKGSAAAVSLGYLVAVFIWLQYSLKFLL